MWRPAILSLAAVAFVHLAGCNTENMWRMDQHSKAPVADDASRASLPDVRIADVQEVDLVEQVLYHRAVYKKSLNQLRDFYEKRGYIEKFKWSENELADANRIKPFKYLLDAEIPATSLRPTQVIPDANDRYARALKLMEEGGHGLPGLYREDKMREAVNVLVELISAHPGSDKIDDAAFLCGEIYKEYFKNQETIAIEWYKRAYTWDPETPHPARFQAAVVSDYRLHDRARALEFYHLVLRDEPANKSNTSFASRRIYELTEGMKQIHDPRPTMEVAGTPTGPSDMFGSDELMAPAPRERNTAPSFAEPSQPSTERQVASDEIVPVVDLGPDENE